METHAFQAETQKLLDLMIHSLYSNKEVFLRELISNSSDALDRRRFEALSNSELTAEADLEIHLVADGPGRKLTISDNGIGDEPRGDRGASRHDRPVGHARVLEEQ